MDDDESEDDSSSSISSAPTEIRTRNDQRQHQCIKQMGKLTKVLRPYLESSMDVEILEKFIGIIDETRPILCNIFTQSLIRFDGGLLFRYFCLWCLS